MFQGEPFPRSSWRGLEELNLGQHNALVKSYLQILPAAQNLPDMKRTRNYHTR